MNHSFSARYKNLLLRPLEEGDIESLRVWRNDSTQTKFLRNIGEITPKMQKKWFQDYLNNSDEYVFAIVEEQKLNRIVGSVALYGFDGDSAEVGKIQIGDAEATGQGIGRIAFTMAMWIGAQKMRLNRFTASVHQENIAAHKSYMRIGFKIVGSHIAPVGGMEDEIEIDLHKLCSANPFVTEITLDVLSL